MKRTAEKALSPRLRRFLRQVCAEPTDQRPIVMSRADLVAIASAICPRPRFRWVARKKGHRTAECYLGEMYVGYVTGVGAAIYWVRSGVAGMPAPGIKEAKAALEQDVRRALGWEG
jgi:hypothetical protein